MKFTKISAIILVLVFLLCIGLISFSYYTGDAIEKSAIDTMLRLHGYRIGFCQRTCINEWLTKYHGEAPDHQAMITFVSFGLGHTDLFLKILRELPASAKAEVVGKVIFAVKDSSLEQEFKTKFAFDASHLKATITE